MIILLSGKKINDVFLFFLFYKDLMSLILAKNEILSTRKITRFLKFFQGEQAEGKKNTGVME
jgi:hypothetical protein